MAEKVMRMPVPSVQKCTCGGNDVGGECAECKEMRGGVLRQEASPDPGGVTEEPSIIDNTLHSRSQPLDTSTRAFMEQQFGRVSEPALGVGVRPANGYDFSRVRVHADAKAAASAQSLNALAYTVGKAIVFGPGQYRPNTDAGARLLAHELTHVVQQSGQGVFARTSNTSSSSGVVHASPGQMVARQPKPKTDQPADPDLNRAVLTIDEKGNRTRGKVDTKGVWRIPVDGIKPHGFQGTDKGPAFESPQGFAIVLIPNIVKPTPEKDKDVPVDVLLHFHGYGVGYRQLMPGKKDYGKTLKEGELRDVDLYQMEQQLLAHVESNKRFMIAVLPQGSESSGFGDIGSKSDEYLKNVFAKLIPTYLPEKAIPGRVTVSAHSGGGPTATEIANQRKGRTDVILFDAINSRCVKEEKKVDGKTVTDKDGKPVMVCKTPLECTHGEYDNASQWVKSQIRANVKALSTKTETEQVTELKSTGTRFRGFTSASLMKEKSCSYGFWYNVLKNDIETTIREQKVGEVVRNQLRENYKVQGDMGSGSGMERHERLMGGSNLKEALKD